MKHPTKRRGKTVTFSVSVDTTTRERLRGIAEANHGGNVSELIARLVDDAARQQALREFLALQGHRRMTAARKRALLADIEAELAQQEQGARRKHGRSAA